jgi:hypothetical protein
MLFYDKDILTALLNVARVKGVLHCLSMLCRIVFDAERMTAV